MTGPIGPQVADAPDLAAGLRAALAHHWQPVCPAADLPGPVGVRLLGRELVVARLGGSDDGGGRVVALADRCPHRSTRLSVGEVDGDCLRCAYHGWAYDADGRCVDVPSLPGGPIPGRARVEAAEAVVEHGLVWVRLDGSVATRVPDCPMRSDPGTKVLDGRPYTWPVAAPRRVENFVDLAHFAFVHDGSLGRRDAPVPPVPEVRRADAELRFEYDPPAYPDERDDTAMLASSSYRMPMPCSVDIAFTFPDGRRRRLWMTASPLDDASCRTFWCIGRTDDLTGDDRDHLAFQDRVLAEDEPVVCNQVPPEMVLDPGGEISVRTDKVSIEYRRWLRELAIAALEGPAAYARALGPHETAGPSRPAPAPATANAEVGRC